MQIVRHEVEKVDIWLHGLCVKVPKILIIRRKSQTNAVLVFVGLPHLPNELCEVFSVSLRASPLWLHRVLLVQVDSREAVLVHELGRKILHQRNVGVIPGPDPKGLGVNGRKGEEEMGVVLGLDILGKDAVAQTVSAVGGQVIPNSLALCRSRALAACLWLDNLARIEVFLARCELV